MRKEMKKIQEQLAKNTVEYSSGGGAVKVVARGDMVVEAIKIDPAAIDPAKLPKLESLIIAAVNGALDSAKRKAGSEMSKLTAGMGIGDLLGG